MNLLKSETIQSFHTSSITCLKVSRCDGLLLSSSSDCTISLYSTLTEQSRITEDYDDEEEENDYYSRLMNTNQRNKINIRQPKSKSTRHKRARTSTRSEREELEVLNGHPYSVSCIEWYTIDNGIFLSSDFDGNVILWDTERFQPEFSFRVSNSKMGGNYTNYNHGYSSSQRNRYSSDNDNNNQISQISLSPYNPSLLAIASRNDNIVKLCDFQTGCSTHQFTSSSQKGNCGVLSIAWNPQREYELVTGAGAAAEIRVFDIRKSGSQALLDILDYNRYYDGSNNNTHMKSDSLLHQKKKIGPNNFSGRESAIYEKNNSNYNCSSGSNNSSTLQNTNVQSLCFSPDGEYLVSSSSSSNGGGDEDGIVTLWDYPTKSVLPKYQFIKSKQLKKEQDEYEQSLYMLESNSANGNNIKKKRRKRKETVFSTNKKKTPTSSSSSSSVQITQMKSSSKSMKLWCISDSYILGYHLNSPRNYYDDDNKDRDSIHLNYPDKILQGHLADITSNLCIQYCPTTTRKDCYPIQMISGDEYGMICQWGPTYDRTTDDTNKKKKKNEHYFFRTNQADQDCWD